MEALFQCTIEMISGNLEDFPEIRFQFFALLKSINKHCFEALFNNISQEQLKFVVDSVCYAIKVPPPSSPPCLP